MTSQPLAGTPVSGPNSNSSINVSPLNREDILGAISCIQRAFATDPYNNWVFDTKVFSKDRNTVSLGIRCEWGINNALFHVAKDATDQRGSVLGVAMWLPPRKVGQPETWYSWWQGWVLWGKQVAMNLWWGRGGLNVKRYYAWKEAQAKAQAELWTDPETPYFCNIVTVQPEITGRGIGKLLFKAVTDRADAEGRKCYLESSRDKPNTAIYERMGFRKVKEMVCEADDGVPCQLYCMMRDPQPISTPSS